MSGMTFTSVWGDGAVITTPVVKFEANTGLVLAESSLCDPDDVLEREYITFPDGTEKDVCMYCHEHILHRIVDANNNPVMICPSCDSNSVPMFPLLNIDWAVLRKQKEILVGLASGEKQTQDYSSTDIESLFGIVQLLDNIQDTAVDTCAASEIEIFGEEVVNG